MMNLIAVDPGVSGGLAIWDGATTTVHKMPESLPFLREFLRDFLPAKALIEKQAASPKWNRFTIMKHGQRYGELVGCMYGMGIGYREVSARTWQKPLGLIVKGSGGFDSPDRDQIYKEKKNAHKEKAAKLYPDQKVYHWNADALLILYYMRFFGCQK